MPCLRCREKGLLQSVLICVFPLPQEAVSQFWKSVFSVIPAEGRNLKIPPTSRIKISRLPPRNDIVTEPRRGGENLFGDLLMARPEEMWQCQTTNCGYIYDPDRGDRKGKVPKGTRFEDLPEDWKCPVCGAGKKMFRPLAGPGSAAAETGQS